MMISWNIFTLSRLYVYYSLHTGLLFINRQTKHPVPEVHGGIYKRWTSPTFKTDAITKIDSQSRCTSAPEFSFSFSSRQDFTLADCLKIPLVRGPFWLRKKSISYGKAGRHTMTPSHTTRVGQVLPFCGCQRPAWKPWTTRARPVSEERTVFARGLMACRGSGDTSQRVWIWVRKKTFRWFIA